MTNCSLVQPLPRNHPSSSKIIRTVLPKELAKAISFGDTSASSKSPLCEIGLPLRLSSIAAEEGTWLANVDIDNYATVRCVAQVVPPSNINLFHRDASNNSKGGQEDIIGQEAIQAILQAAVQLLLEKAEKDDSSKSTQRIGNSFPQCGTWIYEGGTTPAKHQSIADFNKNLPSGVTIQPLFQRNAGLVNDRWQYKSNPNSSLGMIQQMIQLSEEKFGGCIGLFVNDRLVSWVRRYLDGTLGMLFTESEYRKNGYAGLVLMAAALDCRQRRSRMTEEDTYTSAKTDGRMVSYIVDSNDASRNLYQKLGWKRVVDADWVGFASVKQAVK